MPTTGIPSASFSTVAAEAGRKRKIVARVSVVTLTSSARAPACAASTTCVPTSQSGLPASGTDASI